jgi:DNA-binding transcriptional ArsR family regulator
MAYLTTPLDDLLSSRSKLRLLRRLVDGHDDLSGRELARRAGVTWRAAELALRDLVQLAVVHRTDARGQSRYSLVEKHALVREAVVPLFGAERVWAGAVRRGIRDALHSRGQGAKDIRWAGLYGSMARGNDRPDSDLDVAVVANSVAAAARVRLAMDDAGPHLAARFGRTPSVLAFTPSHWRGLIARDAGMRRALTSEAIPLMGDISFSEAVGHGA